MSEPTVTVRELRKILSEWRELKREIAMDNPDVARGIQVCMDALTVSVEAAEKRGTPP